MLPSYMSSLAEFDICDHHVPLLSRFLKYPRLFDGSLSYYGLHPGIYFSFFYPLKTLWCSDGAWPPYHKSLTQSKPGFILSSVNLIPWVISFYESVSMKDIMEVLNDTGLVESSLYYYYTLMKVSRRVNLASTVCRSPQRRPL